MPKLLPHRPTTSRSRTRRSPWSWASGDEWDDVVATSPCATPFHARAWAELMAQNDPRYRARAGWLELQPGTRCLLPLLVRRGPLRKGVWGRAAAMLPGVYGGPLLAGGALDEERWRAFFGALCATSLGRVECFGNPWNDLPQEFVAAAKSNPRRGLRLETRETHWIDLAPGGANPRAGYSKGCKHALTKSQRAGLSVERLGPAHVDEYFAVYQESLARWNKPASRGYRKRLFAAFAAGSACELWGARTQAGELAAVGTFLFSARHCVWWHGSMREAHAPSAPANALIHALLQVARERGCERFDFNPSGGHAGVDSFKRSFGAEKVGFTVWRAAPRLFGLALS